jgi:FHS family L-fucose permease-like MFS transporter
MGLISDRTGSMALAMIIPLICYIFITYYAFIGSRVKMRSIELRAKG